MTSSKWTAQDLPNLENRTFVVTGANSGIGLVDARALGGAGARVVLAVRNTAKGEQAAASIQGHHRGARSSTSPTSRRSGRSPTRGTATSTSSSTTPA